MSNISEKLAAALEKLKQLQDEGRSAIRARDLTRGQREILQSNNFIQPVIKGWYISSRPDDRAGDTTPWYAAFWDFCADYANERFGQDWCLSPERSLQIHVGNRTVPKQLIIRTPKGGNKPKQLIHGTSIFDLRRSLPDAEVTTTSGQLKIYRLPNALIKAAAAFYTQFPTDARAALLGISNASVLLPELLDKGHSTIAGRLCGAFRNIGRDSIANEIKKAMEAVGHDISEVDPFEEKIAVSHHDKIASPREARLRLMWQTMRADIDNVLPNTDGINCDPSEYLRQVDETSVDDAYHSLSIEGYRVTPELIEQVKSGAWNPDDSEADRKNYDALAASGYLNSFKAVKKSLARVLGGENAGIVARQDHGDWFRELFAPLVKAGAQSAGSLAGYRSGRVFIRGSRHYPASGAEVPDLMATFFDLLEQEDNPASRIVLGHFVFVFIHPYSDGNGRTARFLMNLMLASAGYPWTVIRVQDRENYMLALEAASVDGNIKPFADFLGRTIRHQMES